MKKFISHLVQKLKIYVGAHKILSTIALVVIVVFGYWGVGRLTSTTAVTRYVLGTVAKGTVVTSVTGTGQVSVSDQVDLKSKASGDVTYVGATDGQQVTAGTLIAELDATDAEKTVRDAEANLESAKISLQKLQEPADALSLTQAENSLASANQSKVDSQNNLSKAYDSGFNTVSDTYLDLPSIISGLYNILYSSSIAPTSGQWNMDYYTGAAGQYNQSELTRANQYRADADAKYQIAKTAYDQNFADYKAASRLSDTATIQSLINETYTTAQDIAEAVKSANNLIQNYEDTLTQHNFKPISTATTDLTNLNSDTGKTDTDLANLLASKDAIQSGGDAITTAEGNITASTESLAKLKAGPDPLDVQSTQLSVTKNENALLDAQATLADYYIRAPFDGVVAKVNVKKGDSAGTGDVIATFITNDSIAQLSLNELDAAKVKVGQKATLTFDAVSGLNIAGVVSDIDTIGTVTQGVVTYTVKISFATQDPRVKPGMTVSAAIITDVKADVLVVPNSAVKSQGNISYVEVFATPIAQAGGTQGVTSELAPLQQMVQVGLSNDTLTEITSGLNEGDQVITRTIAPTAGAKTTTAPSLLSAVGAGGRGAATGGNARFGAGGGGATRIGG